MTDLARAASHGRRGALRDGILPLALVVGATLVVTAPALWNGFPFVYSDTSSYVADAIERHALWARAPVYSVLILPLHRRVSLWPVAVVQGALVTHLIYLTTRVMLGAVAPLRFLVTVAILTTLTSLPWHSGQVMPDVFTSMVVLGWFLLACAPDRLSGRERAYVAALTGLAVAVHYSHWMLGAGVAGVALALGRRMPGGFGVRRLGLAVAPLVIAWLACVGASAFEGGRWSVAAPRETARRDAVQPLTRIAPYADVFLLARLLQDGPARDYLRAACPAAGFALCPWLDALPPTSDGFLWSPESPLWRVGGVEALRGEAGTITREAIRASPLRVVVAAVRNTAAQLARCRTGDALRPYRERDDDGGQWVPIVLRRYLPSAYPRFLASRQSAGIELGRIRVLHVVVAALGAVALAGLALRFRTRGDRLGVALAVVLLAGIGINAAVSGALSGPHDRYQSRVVWLAPFGALVATARAGRARGARVAATPPARAC